MKAEEPVFEFYDCAFTLDGTMLQTLNSYGASYSSVEHAYKRLGEMTKQCFPNGYKYEELAAMSKAKTDYLMSILHMAALTNILRYPPVVPRSPADPTTH
jgi:nitrogenase molybdenum-iron protein alpha/beta subunit